MAKSQNKTVPTGRSIDDYLAGLDEVNRKQAKQLIPIFQEVTGFPPVLWGDAIVGFGHFVLVSAAGREVEWCLTGFAMRKAAISFYLTFDVAQMGEHLNRLGKHTHGKGCLYVKKLEDIDMSVLREMVEISVKAMDNFSKKS